MYYCYKVNCLKTGKSYIGMTGQKIKDRISSHFRDARRGSLTHFHRAIRKYGESSFSVEIISTHKTQKAALDAEVEAIRLHGTLSPSGYNMTPGGAGVLSMTPESAEKHRQSVLEKHKDPTFKKKHREACKKSFTKERREAISMSKSGRKMHPNAAKAILEAKKTERYRMIARRAAKETWETPGYRQKWRKAKTEKHIKKADRFPIRDDGLIFSSTRAASRYMRENGHPKAAPNNICLACNGKYKKSCGHSWSWIDGDEARAKGGIIT